MNDDYLWDKSGPPDPEIKQLEEILGTLRYQPKPFDIPRDVPAPRRRNYFPLLAAIAAILLVALLAGSVWLRMRSRNEAPPQQAQTAPAPKPSVEQKTIPAPEPEKALSPRERNVAVNYKRRNRSSGLTKREREEALAAKQQLMIALRLASEKLNLVQKKTQSTPPANQIKNQHRVG